MGWRRRWETVARWPRIEERFEMKRTIFPSVPERGGFVLGRVGACRRAVAQNTSETLRPCASQRPGGKRRPYHESDLRIRGAKFFDVSLATARRQAPALQP